MLYFGQQPQVKLSKNAILEVSRQGFKIWLFYYQFLTLASYFPFQSLGLSQHF